MIRRILAILLIVVGLGAAGAGIASATIWKPPTTVTVPLPATPGVGYIITDPGVLGIVNPTVRVHATAEGVDVPVVIAIGRTSEMTAWLEPSDHWRLTGMESWEALTYTAVDGVVDSDADAEDPAATEPVDPNPAGSDMWVEEVNGLGEVTYVWEDIPGEWSMLIASDGGHPAPSLELTWDREVPTPALVPGIVVGSVLVLIGAALLVWSLISRRARDRGEPGDPGQDAQEDLDDSGLPSPSEIMAGLTEQTRAAAGTDTDTDEFVPVVDADDADSPYPHQFEAEEPHPQGRARAFTRREIRERERLNERAKTLGVPDPMDTGPIPWPTQETPIVGTGELDIAEIRESISADRTTRAGELAGAEVAPVVETPTDTSGPIKAPPLPARKRRKIWGRRKNALQDEAPALPDLPFEIDEETAEMLRTGEIDLSALNPQASGASWRASWGLGSDARGPWVPIEKLASEPTEDEAEGQDQ